MDVHDNILELVGNTPLVRLRKITHGLKPKIFAKLESLNPNGSVKDRIALHMIEVAEREGKLKPGGTIIEATSGNTGAGLAMAAAVKGYRAVFVVLDKVAPEKIALLRAFGAEVVIAPTAVPFDHPDSYMNVANRLEKETPGAWMARQHFNLSNPESHYLTTGPEIWRQTDGQLNVLVAGAGTGGTITGIAQFLKEKNPKLHVVDSDPEGSIFSGDTPRPYKVEGIGEDFYPSSYDPKIVDEYVRVSDRNSFLTARRITREEGILVGGSSGTAMWATLQVAARYDENSTIVVIFPDTGRGYLSKLYSDDWMKENGYMPRFPFAATVEELLRERPPFLPSVVCVSAKEPVGLAIDTMQRYGVSQMPIVSAGEGALVSTIVGSIQEKSLLDRVFRQPEVINASVEKVMEPSLPVAQADEDVDRAFTFFASGTPALIVAKGDETLGVITKLDVLEFMTRRQRGG